MLGLLAQAFFDSAIGAWIAFGSLAVLLAMRFAAWAGLWPADWPEFFDTDD